MAILFDEDFEPSTYFSINPLVLLKEDMEDSNPLVDRISKIKKIKDAKINSPRMRDVIKTVIKHPLPQPFFFSSHIVSLFLQD